MFGYIPWHRIHGAVSLGGAVVLTAVLTGCVSQAPSSSTPASGTTTSSVVKSPTALAAVSSAQATLSAAGHLVLACYATPDCVSVAPKPQIKAAFDAAYKAVTDAQTVADAGGSPDMTLSSAALSSLQLLLAQLPKTAS